MSEQVKSRACIITSFAATSRLGTSSATINLFNILQAPSQIAPSQMTGRAEISSLYQSSPRRYFSTWKFISNDQLVKIFEDSVANYRASINLVLDFSQLEMTAKASVAVATVAVEIGEKSLLLLFCCYCYCYCCCCYGRWLRRRSQSEQKSRSCIIAVFAATSILGTSSPTTNLFNILKAPSQITE